MVEMTPLCRAAVFPRPLEKGDKIAVLAPSGPVKSERVEKAVRVLREEGYVPVIYPTVYKANGQFSGTPRERFEDVKKAFSDPEIRAIICARGGYGFVHIIDSIAGLPIENDPKWVVGFSDITAFHGLMASKGIASIHGPMALHLANGDDDPQNRILFDIFEGKFPEYNFKPHYMNHKGKAVGKLIGGNLSVIEGLINSPYDLILPGSILFIEDVGEDIYKIERMMYQLKLSGALSRLSGLIVGRFTEIPKGRNYDKVEPMIRDILSSYPDLPVAFDIPIGHIRGNIPVIESSLATLEVTRAGVRLSMEEWPGWLLDNEPRIQWEPGDAKIIEGD